MRSGEITVSRQMKTPDRGLGSDHIPKRGHPEAPPQSGPQLPAGEVFLTASSPKIIAATVQGRIQHSVSGRLNT